MMADITPPSNPKGLKRLRGTPTLMTPQRPRKRAPMRGLCMGIRRLTFEDETGSMTRHTITKWSDAEVKAVVEFVLFHGDSTTWPTHNQLEFWSNAANFVKSRANSTCKRSGMYSKLRFELMISIFIIIASACRYKVIVWLRRRYASPRQAEEFYFPELNLRAQTPTQTLNVEMQTDPTSVATVGIQTSLNDLPDSPVATDTLIDGLNQLSMEHLMEVLSNFFSKYCRATGVSVPDDFLSLSIKAMVQLKRSYRGNVVYNLAKGLGTPRPDGSDSRFPTMVMPMGLVEHITNFFVADTVQQVRTSLHLLHIMYLVNPRCPPVLLTIGYGSRLCTFNSVRNGLSSTMDLCGV